MEPKKRTIDESVDYLEGIKALVLDIEGTTTPITFVKETLFPYIKENVEEHVKSHFDEEECQQDIDALREQGAKDVKDEVEGAIAIPAATEEKDDIIKAVVAKVLWEVENDKKFSALKQLQGHMWRTAYKAGNIKGEVYDDVLPALKRLIADEKKVYIYSSGSVEAQKLLYGYSNQGDLLEYFSGYFDTKVGSKAEQESYKKIAEESDQKPEEMLFLTDVPKEAKAAAEAGMKSIIVVRPGNVELSEEDQKTYNTISSFSELFVEN
ncbi:enolase-phosphatase E1-like [Lineus longissimus]|uniref:enolase-phosphatase E1-like n=1 Tax=Lineus longissimus TaxID=88925 RepID=UPI002B4D2041